MEWKYEGQELTEVPEGAIGFVYRITCIPSGRQYIGKKLFHSARSRMVKLKSNAKKKKKQRFKVESDWREYYGSNDELIKDVQDLGPVFFRREILRLCKSKGECSYFEAKYQFVEGALENPTKFYNKWISVRVRASHMKGILDAP